MSDGITEQIVMFIQKAHITDPQLYEKTRMLILDHIAASFAGYQYNVQFNKAIERIYVNLQGNMESAFFMGSKKLPVCTAAFMNAIYAHGADMDDGHMGAMGHIGASVISAVAALADYIEVTEHEVIEAIIIGYQVFARVAMSAQPGIVKRGFHSTAIAGAIACAAACAKLLKLGFEQMYSAVSMAAVQSGGLLVVGETGQLIKPLNPARAAEQGVFSALTAQQGIIGPFHPLESPKGWFHAMSENFDKDILLHDFDQFQAVKECYIKPYPSCRHTHCGIEAAIRLHKRIKKGIRNVVIYTYENAIYLTGVICYPKKSDEAKFSLTYTLACALYYGTFGFEQLQLGRVDKNVYELISRIKVVCDPDMEDIKKGIRGARVIVTDENYENYEELVLMPKGEPENAFNWNDMAEKFSQCSAAFLDLSEQQELIRSVKLFGSDKKFNYCLGNYD